VPDLLIDAWGITKSFEGVQALRGVSFDLRAGEVHALIGENGAGKSTLVRIITGAVTPDSGTLAVRGHAVRHMDPATARSFKIAAIYQQPALFPDMTVAENIALGLEGNGLWRLVNWKSRRRLASELLERAGSSISPDRLASTLSMPEQQVVEIARAIGAEARILIMDEPTASLSDQEVASLFEAIARLQTEGAGIIYISHRLEEIAAIADRITVLRDGATVGTKLSNEVGAADLIRMMVGRELAAVFPKRAVPVGETVLELRHISSRAAGVSNISLTVRSGEILGIGGLVGSGRTELAETVFGLTPADSGEILLHGKSAKISSPRDAVDHHIGYVPEDRRRNGVILDMPVAANTSLANLKAVSNHGLIERGAENSLAQAFLGQLRIKAPGIETAAGALSGGNQQKVALARWLATEPAVLILDEPTQGIDVGSKAEIHSQMVNLAEHGLAIILISSEMPELLGMSDRIAVMHGGRINAVLPRDKATPQNILALALGHPVGLESTPI
jgi:rhamnose transport system ATP-binding protein